MVSFIDKSNIFHNLLDVWAGSLNFSNESNTVFIHILSINKVQKLNLEQKYYN